MRRFPAALVVLALSPVVAFADDPPAYAPASEAHRPGRWSMQFQVDDDFQLSGFNGAGLALTRNSSSSSAWRMGVELHGHTSGGELTSGASGTSGTFQSSQDLPDDDHFGFGVDLLRLKRFHPDRRIDLELALGPRITFDHAKSTSGSPIGDLGFSTDENRIETQQYGVLGRFGVEVFLARALSVHAHYGAFLGYRHTEFMRNSHETYNDGRERDVHTDSTVNLWSLDNLGVTLGVSAYL